MAKRSREDSWSSSSDIESAVTTPSAIGSGASEGGPAKYTLLDNGNDSREEKVVMRCSLPPHREALPFVSYEEFEIHYAKFHANRCVECRKNFPSEHFLGLHISENHDPLNEARKARGEKTYGCFVVDCDRKCSSLQKRRLHLIDKHMFPKNYDFRVIDTGIDKRSSLLRSDRSNNHRPRGSAADRAARQTQSNGSISQKPAVEQSGSTLQSDPSMEIDSQSRETLSDLNASLSPEASYPPRNEESTEASLKSKTSPFKNPVPTKQPVDNEMTDLTKSMSALKFIPPSVRFGRGRGRSGFSRS
ncbi:hypothetical protein L228DRAFT_267938 [Xylona heveae TC161]|uniref:C2H2-type domain-containing protein n=1 Tax=Xylona heveae (strain CBS 132557 / TC161) TaxID=1328760 RepID=A0A165GSI9_XYLHT|nr:hypothetical protein L228DRAFT_267938 [Xylona heveae TC161]KZF22542.1 hypothetical protein L228DRAFT_267938 [Xylona heveae TC161]